MTQWKWKLERRSGGFSQEIPLCEWHAEQPYPGISGYADISP
ncbi:MAG: hypothetical protein H6R45_743 [Proteobacteria bacterium]|nr:hypothetical protein [Pseudomonadota bacterium]